MPTAQCFSGVSVYVLFCALVLHARKYSKQEDVPAMEQTEMEMKIIPGSPTLQLNGLPLGKVNPLADYHQDVDNLSGETNDCIGMRSTA